jgi:hypothetical protein
MKKSSLFLTTVVLIAIGLSGKPVFGQGSSSTQKENEKLEQTIDLQKKALADEQKNMKLQLELSRLKMDSIMEHGENGVSPVIFRRGGRASGGPDAYDIMLNQGLTSSGQGSPYPAFYGRGGDSERTTWDYSKQVKESTYSKDLSFDVEKTAKSVSMSLMGDCKSGQIRVKILMPNGKLYSDVVIDESGNLNWRKSFSITDELNKDKTGEWKFKIEAEKATGYFKITLQTF